MKLKKVLVIWNDAHGDPMRQIWTSEELTQHKPVVVFTIGFLYKEDEVGVTLFTEMIEDDATSFRGKMFIPKGMIVSMDTLTVSRKRKKGVTS
jgi:predicted dinucleotide-utilizing enzyme